MPGILSIPALETIGEAEASLPVPPRWKQLGWPSEAAYAAAGMPGISYPEWSAQQHAGANEAMYAMGPDPFDEPTTSRPPDPFTAGLDLGLVNAARMDLAMNMNRLPPAPEYFGPEPPVSRETLPLAPAMTPEEEEAEAFVAYLEELTGETALDRLQDLYGAVEDLPADVRESFLMDYRNDVGAGEAPHVAYRSLLTKAQETRTGSARAVGPMAREYDLTNPLSLLAAANAPFEMLGEGLATAGDLGAAAARGNLGAYYETGDVDLGLEGLPGGNVARRTLELAPQFASPAGRAAFLPAFLRSPGLRGAAGLAAAAAIGGEATEELGLGAGAGEIIGPVVGPGLVNLARTGLQAGAGAIGARLRPQAAAEGLDDVDSIFARLAATEDPAVLASEIDNLSLEQQFALSSRISETMGRDTMRQWSELVNHAREAAKRAAAEGGPNPFRDTNHLRNIAREMASRIEAQGGVYRQDLPAAGLVGEAPPAPRPQTTATAAPTTVTPPRRPRIDQGDLWAVDVAAPPPAGSGTPRNLVDVLNPVNLSNEMRQLSAGQDFSNIMRQGGLTIRHGREFLANVRRAFNAGIDGTYASRVNAQLKKSRAARAGVFLSDLPGEGPATLRTREENFAGSIAENLPGYKQTGRGNTVFINGQRVDVFDSVTTMWKRADEAAKAGNAGPYERLINALARPGDEEALARYINRLTGRGTLGPLDSTWVADALGVAMFSPKFQMSRPQAVANLFNFRNPRVAVEAAKDFATYFGAVTSVLAMANAAGVATVELDPTDSDFGQARIGDSRIDPWAGLRPFANLTARILTGAAQDGKVDLDVLERWFRSKLAPLPSHVYDAVFHDNEDFLGRDKDAGNFMLSLFPIWAQGIYEAASEGLLGAQMATLPAEFIGLGTNSYIDYPERLQDESRDAIGQAVAAGVLPGVPAGASWFDLHATEKRKLRNWAQDTGNTELLGKIIDFEENRRESVFTEASRQVATAWQEADPVLASLWERLNAGEMTQQAFNRELDLITDEVYGAYDNPEYQDAIDALPDSDVYKAVDDYRQIPTVVRRTQSFGSDEEMGELIDAAQAAYIEGLEPGLRDRVLNIVAGEPDRTLPAIVRYRQEAKPLRDAYLAAPDKEQWRRQNPDADFLFWLLGYVDTVMSPQAAELARGASTGREVKMR